MTRRTAVTAVAKTPSTRPIAEAEKPRSWPRMGTRKLCTSQLDESSQLTSSKRVKPGASSRSQARRRSALGVAAAGRASAGTRRAQTRLASGSSASTAKARRKPLRSISTPASTGPTTFDSAGARPSQLKIRLSSVESCAIRPAARWIAIRPTLAPAPVNVAATQSTAKLAWPR